MVIPQETLDKLNLKRDKVLYLIKNYPRVCKNYNYLIAFYMKEFLNINLSEDDIYKIGKCKAFETIQGVRRYLKNEEGGTQTKLK